MTGGVGQDLIGLDLDGMDPDGMELAGMELVGAHEIRMMFGGISRQRVYQITSRSDFPRYCRVPPPR